MPSITITTPEERVERVLESGTTALDLFREDRRVVVARINGQLKDLATELVDGDDVEPVDIESDDGLFVMRHSAAHVMAQAVQELYPGTMLGIGPPIKDGFYYDFDAPEPFQPDDLKKVEKQMQRIIKSGQQFRRRAVSEDEARRELADEKYKLRLIGSDGGAEVMEVGGDELTIYDNLDRQGDVIWNDLCRGPHVPNTRYIPANAVKVMRSSAAYWLGDQSQEDLQRMYGTAWPQKEQLKAYLDFLAEAERRDHRRIGAELDLFSFPEEIGSGLPVFHPRGGTLRRVMEDYSRLRHEAAGYEFVNTPHITKGALFETSGHLEWYSEGMFPRMHLDEERDEDGHVKRQGQDYYLKPMNCPFHNLIYRSRGRSYRELPMRLFEFGSVYRYERSGVVQGLTRVRGMTQDDAHIYCTREQMQDELKSLLSFVLELLKDFGLDDFYLELSTRNPDKYVGDIAEWDEATDALRHAAEDSGLELVPDPGGAAFYGPKISVQAKDAIGRTWQMSTIQLDFQLPRRFDLEYTGPDGSRQRPIMIHRALFGSIERFIGVLTEHYAGAFPAWLSPIQVVGIPVGDAHYDYLEQVMVGLRNRGIRAEMDAAPDRMQKKIRNAQKQKIPYMLIAGDDDMSQDAVSFRYRNGEQKNGVPIAAAIDEIVSAVESRQ